MNYDLKHMRRCIQLARCGEAGAAPNPMVGAVVVCDGRIIGEGFHRRCGGPHAEVNAINSVKEKQLLSRSTIYVSLEPCAHFGKTPPCADLIIQSGIPRVVIGCADPFAKVNGLGIKKLQDAGCEVVVGVLEEECRELNRRFFTFHQKHRPWIMLKWAQSKDGSLSPVLPKGERDKFTPPMEGKGEAAVFFSNPFTQTLVHRLRARSGAILVGTRTAILDNPTLTTRLWTGPNPLRLTIDRRGILPPTLHLKDGSTPTVIYTHESLQEILSDLYNRGIQSLLVEGGSKLLQSFIDAGLWDEARIETAPFSLGEGVPAPILTEGKVVSKCCYFGNKIETIRK
ncbi:MAG: bifunctional diaminohydroxyphosphoribosylaminopyrimidine deaminase/5-amino-6-(5-phosphoribosylamino)uracil reductase RibD [Bacteroidaceae bacterium]|nr:bifunctional diaminohydroxyphosphoribosylaminopyrimidine deaminase/5-amino-6-(5-phosphoribosylamino)uracil reductase RibD [Bacteroidaceae bacterium]